MISDRDLREWGLLLLLLLLGILLMFAAGQLAIRLTPAWQVEADMGSNINPDEGYANAEGTLVFEPLDPAIMTQPAWAITPSPTPVLVLGTPTPEMSPTVTVTGTTTPTPTVTGTTTVSPTITRTATSTASPTATSTTSNPPILPTNTPVPPPGTIVIVMDSLPSGPQDFSFLGSLGDFALDDDSNPTLPNTRTFPNLPPGTYTVIEGLQAGWTLAGLSCSDGSPVNLGSRAATIHLASNEIVTCTFINASQGTVTIMKDSLPDDPQNFTFSGSLGAFTLDDDANPNYDNALIFAGLLPGTYTVSEGNLPGWTLTNLTCTDPDGGSSGDLGTRTATIDVDLNETILCIFTNSERGSITILKDSQPDDPQDFTFSGSLNAFTLDDDPGDSTLDHLHTFGGLVPGVYTVRENDPAAAGWYLSGLSCSDGSPGDLGTRTASITLDPGEHVTCTFTNARRGTITIVKNTVGGDGTFDFVRSFGADFSLDTAGGSASTTFSNLLPGTYTVAETVPAGWDLTGTVCSDGSPVTAISVSAGENITCTFTNTRRGTITIVKNTVGGNDTFGFTSALLGPFNLTTVAGAASTTFPNLLPGAYTVIENDPSGINFDLTGLSCSDGSPGDLGTRTASITLDPGEHVTCTFTNTRRGTITIVKDAYPDDPQDFTFLRSFGANFSLDDDADATLPNTITFLNVPAGSHTVTENTVVNWTLTGLSCSDPTGGSSVNLGGRTATIVLDSGETVICTFLNSYNPYPNIGIGPGDGNTTPIPANNSITLALSTPIYAHGGNEWDLIYFEMYNAGCGGICMDFVTIQISADGSLWQTVLAYGGSQYSNSSLNGFPEVDDQSIPEAALELSPYMIHATGVGIDIDALSLPLVNYYYIRITSPLGDNDGVCDVDSILIVP